MPGAVFTRYNLSPFDFEKAKGGMLCAIVSKNIAHDSGLIYIDDVRDVCVNCTHTTVVNGEESTVTMEPGYVGRGVCRLTGPGSLCISLNSTNYMFNAQGMGTGSSSLFYKLLMLTISTDLPSAGERVTRAFDTGTDSGITVTGISARDEFASQALKGLMARVSDPSSLSDSEINYYCSTAYRWASLMMLTAANVRDQHDTSVSEVSIGSLDSNVERLLNNIAVAIEEGGIGGVGGNVSIQNAPNTDLNIAGTHTVQIGAAGLGRDALHPLYVNLSGSDTPGEGGVNLNAALSAINADVNIGTPTVAGTAIIWNGSSYVWGNPGVDSSYYYTKTEVNELLDDKVDKVIGKELSTNDFTDILLGKLNGIDYNANYYVHPTASAATITVADGKVLSAITVNGLGHVTSVNSKTLSANDIPSLGISKITGLQDALNSKLDIAFFSSLFKAYAGTTEVTPNNSTSTVDNIKAMFGFWTEQYISTLGQNSAGNSGGGIGNVLWSELADNSNTNQIALSHLTGAIETLTGGVADGQNYNVFSYNNHLFVNVPWTDTKNTAGSTNTTDKIYLVGAKSQAANAQTYSNSNCYASGGYLYSGGSKVLTGNQSISLTGDVTGSGTTSIATTIGTGKVTNAMLAGSIANNKLANSSLTVNGSSVSLGGSVTTSKWGTSRNISISDSDSSNTGTAVSVDGSGNATLKLPSTIKASLNGNAATATVAETANKLSTTTKNAWGQTYWTSGGVPTDISGNMTGVGTIAATGDNTITKTGKNAPIFAAVNGVGRIELMAAQNNRGVYDRSGNTWLIGTGPATAYDAETPANPNTFLLRGNVGIGTTTPSQKLHVIGNIMASGAVSALGTSADGTSGGALAALSDVNITGTPTTGYVLTFNGSNWVPQAAQNGDLSDYALKTWVEANYGDGVRQVKVGTTTYNPNASGLVSLPAYPNTSDLRSLSKNNTTAISSNSNLNNYTTAGTYTTTGGNAGSSVAASLLNKPSFTEGFRMYVTQMDPTSSYVHQRILTYAGKVFDRVNGNTNTNDSLYPWFAWRELAYTDSVVERATRLDDSATKTAWGQNYWVDGQPANITGPMTGVTSIDNMMYFNSSKVGIGTNNPTYKLDISGSVGISGGDLNIIRTGAITGVFTENTSGGYDIKYQATGSDYRLWFGIGSGNINRGIYGYERSSGGSISNGQWYLYFINDSNKTNGRTVLNYGNVGIGTSTPSQKLHVAGNIMATGAVSALGTSAAGSTGGALAALSDVNINGTPATGYVLTFNGSKWVPQATQQQSLAGYLPLAGGIMTGTVSMQSGLSAANYPTNTGWAIGIGAMLNQHSGTDTGNRGGLYYLYGRETNSSQDRLLQISLACLSEYKSDPWNGNYGLQITADDISWKGTSIPTVKTINDYAGDNFADVLKGYSGTFFFQGGYLKDGQYDWVGLQIGSNVDKGQIMFEDGTLVVRQNDSGGTNTTGWTTWKKLLPLTAGTSYPLTGDLWLNGNLVAGNPNNTINDNSAKIAFYTNKNYPNISPYIQAIYEASYGRKRLSVFQKNDADWDKPQVEVFTIKPDGKVGIGTITPAYKLDVNGHIAGSNVYAGDYLFMNKGAEGIYLDKDSLSWHNSSHLYTVNLLKFTSDGNVGIGTTPDSKLHVVNECHFAGGAKFKNICIEVNNSIAASGRESEINNYNANLHLQYNSSTNCTICYGGGNVGIGTRTPTTKLDVNGVGHFTGDSNSKYGIILDNDQAITLKDSAANLHRALFLNNTTYNGNPANILALGYGTASRGSYDTQICGKNIRFSTGGGTVANPVDPVDRMQINDSEVHVITKIKIGPANGQGGGYIEWDSVNQMLHVSGGKGIYADGAVSALGLSGDINGQITRPLTFTNTNVFSSSTTFNGSVVMNGNINSDVTLGSYTQNNATQYYKFIFGSSGPYMQRNGGGIKADVGNNSFTVNGNLSVTGSATFTGAATFNGNATIPQGKYLNLGTTNYQIFKDTNSYITIKGATKFTGAVTMNNSLTVSGALTVNGNTTLKFLSADGVSSNGSINVNGDIVSNMSEGTDENGIVFGYSGNSNYGKLYAKTDGKLYWKADGGTEREIKFV